MRRRVARSSQATYPIRRPGSPQAFDITFSEIARSYKFTAHGSRARRRDSSPSASRLRLSLQALVNPRNPEAKWPSRAESLIRSSLQASRQSRAFNCVPEQCRDSRNRFYAPRPPVSQAYAKSLGDAMSLAARCRPLAAGHALRVAFAGAVTMGVEQFQFANVLHGRSH